MFHNHLYPSIEKYNSDLKSAIFKNNLEAVQQALKNGANPNLIIDEFWQNNALTFAATLNYKEIVQELLNAKANPNIQNKNGTTALMYAAVKNYKEIVQALLNAKANPNIQNENGATALICAAEMNCKEIVQALLNAKANVNAQDNTGRTALICAANNNYKEIVQALLNANANVNAQDNTGRTALICAANNNYKEIVQALLNANANVNTQDNTGRTILETVNHPEIAQLLILNGTTIPRIFKTQNTDLVKKTLKYVSNLANEIIIKNFFNSRNLSDLTLKKHYEDFLDGYPEALEEILLNPGYPNKFKNNFKPKFIEEVRENKKQREQVL